MHVSARLIVLRDRARLVSCLPRERVIACERDAVGGFARVPVAERQAVFLVEIEVRERREARLQLGDGAAVRHPLVAMAGAMERAARTARRVDVEDAHAPPARLEGIRLAFLETTIPRARSPL